jgi:hypothetical protein
MYRSRCAQGASAAIAPALRLSILGALLACAGCASNQSAPSGAAGPMASADPQYWRVEVEDDGVPAQLAPRIRPSVVDDPTEPWSPNYGSRVPGPSGDSEPKPPADAVPAVPAAPSRPAKTRPSTAANAPATATASSIAMMDADEVIRRAVAEHEMRQGNN